MESQSVVMRFAGDSGDGVQLMGTQFVAATALAGNDFATFPDYPAEIRAPAGTTFGVSAYQIHLGARPITTAGDAPHVLVAFNPAALKVNLPLIADGALIVLNIDTFTSRGLAKAGYENRPARRPACSTATRSSRWTSRSSRWRPSRHSDLSKSDAGRCKNFWALGLVQWMFNRDVASIEGWITKRFAKEPIDSRREPRRVARRPRLRRNRGAHGGGAARRHWHGAVSAGRVSRRARQRGARARPCRSRRSSRTGKMIFCSYPITPASPLLHQLARYGTLGVGVFQAEDEIAAVCAAIGASYGGAIGVTSSSGPGIALKTEAIGLAINAELPLIIVDSQRGGPSTGLPTKTEQSDLYQAVYGRNADAPIPVIAARSRATASRLRSRRCVSRCGT